MNAQNHGTEGRRTASRAAARGTNLADPMLQSEHVFGTFPLLKNERTWSALDFTWVNTALAIATSDVPELRAVALMRDGATVAPPRSRPGPKLSLPPAHGVAAPASTASQRASGNGDV